MDDSKTLKNIDRKLSALIALIALSISKSIDNKSNVKLEVILSEVGLESVEIAKILGKKLTAIQKAIQRAKK